MIRKHHHLIITPTKDDHNIFKLNVAVSSFRPNDKLNANVTENRWQRFFDTNTCQSSRANSKGSKRNIDNRISNLGKNQVNDNNDNCESNSYFGLLKDDKSVNN